MAFAREGGRYESIPSFLFLNDIIRKGGSRSFRRGAELDKPVRCGYDGTFKEDP